jgi:hypothetical protein
LLENVIDSSFVAHFVDYAAAHEPYLAPPYIASPGG